MPTKIQHMSDVELKNNSTFTLDHTQLDLTAADAGWNIDSTSTLAMQDSTDLDFASHLQGDGPVTVDLGGRTIPLPLPITTRPTASPGRWN